MKDPVKSGRMLRSQWRGLGSNPITSTKIPGQGVGGGCELAAVTKGSFFLPRGGQ